MQNDAQIDSHNGAATTPVTLAAGCIPVLTKGSRKPEMR